MKVFGVVLIVLGLIGVAYGGFKWTHQEKVVDLGPVEVTHDKTERVPIPPIAGAICPDCRHGDSRDQRENARLRRRGLHRGGHGVPWRFAYSMALYGPPE